MKTLLPNGSELIVGSSNRTPFSLHDTWPSHSRNVTSLETAYTNSGVAFWVLITDLIDNSTWYYVYQPFFTFDDIIPQNKWMYRANFLNVPPPNMGEKFNYLIRQKDPMKMTEAEYVDWGKNN
jgi:hypothetical protein